MRGAKVKLQHCQHVGTRAEQQDTIRAISDSGGHLMILADGMGGMRKGAMFSRCAVEAVVNRFEATISLAPPERLFRLYQVAQEAVVRAQEEENEGGTTIAMALIARGALWFLSVGDSRIYLVRGGGAIVLTRDQICAPLLEQRAAMGYLDMQDVLYHTGRDMLDNFLGTKKPRAAGQNQIPIRLLEGDCVALMSDGVYKTLSEQKIGKLLSTKKANMAGRVIEEVLKAQEPKQDNCSIILALL